MSKVTMPDPVAWLRSDELRKLGEPYSDSPLNQRTDSMLLHAKGTAKAAKQYGHDVSVITTTQAEAYADAGVREAQQWQPIETAPKDGTEILAWRDDCGVFIASYTSASAFPLRQSEIEELDEDELFSEDWFTQWPQAVRLDGSEKPTHWIPLPAPPQP